MSDARADLARQKLERTGKSFIRAKQTYTRERAELAEAVDEGVAAGLGPAEITRLISYGLTERTVHELVAKAKAKQRPPEPE